MLYNLGKMILIDPVFISLFGMAFIFLLLLQYKNENRLLIVRNMLGFVIAILYLFSIAPVKNSLFNMLERDYVQKDVYYNGKLDIVVVLSGGSYESKNLDASMPSFETPSRLLHAHQIFHLSRADYLVCTGKGSNTESDAEVMAAISKKLGIPESKIIIESKSRNTMEHAVELNKLITDKELRIGIVTSGYHMKRSMREFGKYFKNLIPLPSEYYHAPFKMSLFTFLPSSHNLFKSSIAIRELTGNLWYLVRY